MRREGREWVWVAHHPNKHLASLSQEGVAASLGLAKERALKKTRHLNREFRKHYEAAK